MRMLSVTLTALAPFLVAAPAMADSADSATATLVDPNNASGITADVIFRDNGRRLLVTGEAEGMDPKKRYISLIYDQGSSPTNPNACTPPTAGNTLNFDQMQLADWQPIGSSTRTLRAERLGVAFVPLTRIGTVSIRRFDQTGTGPAAALVLQACGKVVPRR